LLAGVLLISLIAAIFEYRNLRNNHQVREITVSAILLLAGLTLGILRYFDVSIPSPLYGIRALFQPASQYLMRLLS
jgi:hypothetical protein